MLKIFIGIGLGFLLFSNQGARQTTADILGQGDGRGSGRGKMKVLLIS